MRVYVFGAGGHAKVVVATLLEMGATVQGLFDDDPATWGKELLGAGVLGPISDAANMKGEAGVIAVGDNSARLRLARQLGGWQWITAVHPKAIVHSTAQLGPGTVVFAGAIIQPHAKLGAHCIINTAATVDHDCSLEDFVHIAPGVHLGGNVLLREGAMLGVGSVVIPGRQIGEWSIVGAGSAVISDVPGRCVASGVPARLKRRLAHLPEENLDGSRRCQIRDDNW